MKRKTSETDTKRLNFFLLYRIFHLWFTLAKFYGVVEFFVASFWLELILFIEMKKFF